MRWKLGERIQPHHFGSGRDYRDQRAADRGNGRKTGRILRAETLVLAIDRRHANRIGPRTAGAGLASARGSPGAGAITSWTERPAAAG